jgi:GxxExxY protein
MGKGDGEHSGTLPDEINQITGQIVDAAFRVHSALGPGLLESVYEACMLHELGKRGLKVQSQVALPVVYDGIRLETGLRLDLLIESCVVVELKAAEELLPVHEAQLLTYLKLSGLRVGLLINFNVPRIKDGIVRMVL